MSDAPAASWHAYRHNNKKIWPRSDLSQVEVRFVACGLSEALRSRRADRPAGRDPGCPRRAGRCKSGRRCDRIESRRPKSGRDESRGSELWPGKIRGGSGTVAGMIRAAGSGAAKVRDGRKYDGEGSGDNVTVARKSRWPPPRCHSYSPAAARSTGRNASMPSSSRASSRRLLPGSGCSGSRGSPASMPAALAKPYRLLSGLSVPK
jgi:hypothetical protein